MLNDVERRGFLVKPTRKSPLPLPVRALDIKLDESAGELLGLPRGGHLTGAKPDNHILPTRRLTGMESDILDDPVALVEDSEHRDALRHRCDPSLSRAGRPDFPGSGSRGVLLLRTLAARGERERDQQQSSGSAHDYSGIQGS